MKILKLGLKLKLYSMPAYFRAVNDPFKYALDILWSFITMITLTLDQESPCRNDHLTSGSKYKYFKIIDNGS